MDLSKKLYRIFDIFCTFFKIGLFTFGGGYAMIPLIEREVSVKKGWVKREEIVDILAVSQALPGAVAINSASFIGKKVVGRFGALAGTTGVILPSLIIITMIAVFFSRFQENAIVQAAFTGIRPAVVALIFVAALNVIKSSLKDKLQYVLALAATIVVLLFAVNVIIVIICGAAAGLLIYWLFPGKVKKMTGKGGKSQ